MNSRTATTNLFELLSDEAPAQQVPAKKDSASAPSKTSKPLVGGQKAGSSQPQRANNQVNKSGSSNTPKQSRSNDRGNRGSQNAPFETFSNVPEGRVRKEFNNKSRDRPRRGGRGREFDRSVSGTGRSQVENKKSGGGSHNWGRTDAKKQWEEATTEESQVEVQHSDKPVEEEAAPEVVQEPEEVQLSLDDFEKLRLAKSKELAEKYGLQKERRVIEPPKDVTALPLKRELPKQSAQSTSSNTAQTTQGGVSITDLFNVVPAKSDRGRFDRKRGGRGGRGQNDRKGSKNQRTFDATKVDDKSFPALA